MLPKGELLSQNFFLWESVLSGPQVALINAVLFLASIGVFLWILIFNAMRRRDVIANAIHYPLPGCPSVHSGIEWAQWVPGEWSLTIHALCRMRSACSFWPLATVFECILFFWAIYKTISSTVTRWKEGHQISLYHLILRDNIFYFFGWAVVFQLLSAQAKRGLPALIV